MAGRERVYDRKNGEPRIIQDNQMGTLRLTSVPAKFLDREFNVLAKEECRVDVHGNRILKAAEVVIWMDDGESRHYDLEEEKIFCLINKIKASADDFSYDTLLVVPNGIIQIKEDFINLFVGFLEDCVRPLP